MVDALISILSLKKKNLSGSNKKFRLAGAFPLSRLGGDLQQMTSLFQEHFSFSPSCAARKVCFVVSAVIKAT